MLNLFIRIYKGEKLYIYYLYKITDIFFEVLVIEPADMFSGVRFPWVDGVRVHVHHDRGHG